MKIGIDFDRVLFKTDEFNEYLKEETGLHHVEMDVYDENGCYSPKKHAKACGISVEEVFQSMNDLNRFLYPDVDKLKELKQNHELVIVTRGEEKFQTKKIKNSKVHRLFNQLYIVQNASKDVADIDLLVDDREEEIENVDVPGIIFDREKQDLEDIIKDIGELE
jgi:FMN phosphatase YigB (HAD superfamily)